MIESLASLSDSSLPVLLLCTFQFIPRVSRGNQNQQYLPSTIQIPSPNPCSSRRLSQFTRAFTGALQLCHALGHKACSAWPYLHHVTLTKASHVTIPDHKEPPPKQVLVSFLPGQKNIAFSEHMLSVRFPKTLPPIPVSLCQKSTRKNFKIIIAILH